MVHVKAEFVKNVEAEFTVKCAVRQQDSFYGIPAFTVRVRVLIN
jgi:hypothetical protein